MRKIGFDGVIGREGQPIKLFGEVYTLKYDNKTQTPYVTVRVGRRELEMPLLPGDIVGFLDTSNMRFKYLEFTGTDRGYKEFEYTPFGKPLAEFIA